MLIKTRIMLVSIMRFYAPKTVIMLGLCSDYAQKKARQKPFNGTMRHAKIHLTELCGAPKYLVPGYREKKKKKKKR